MGAVSIRPGTPPADTFVFDGITITVIIRDGEPWFMASEIAAVLGYRVPSEMNRLLKDKHKGVHSVHTLGGMQSASIISEPGFYQAVMSRKPSARAMPGMVERIERFQDWVTEEVLPSIRRTGSYALPTAPQPVDPIALLEDPAILRSLLGRYAERVEQERQGRIAAEAQVEQARPAVDFVEALADSDGLWGLRAAGKALRQGPDLFIKWLRERRDLYDLNGGPVAKQTLIDRGLFEVVWTVHGGKPRPTTKLTGKGMVFYARELGVRPPGPPPQALLPGL